MNIVVTVVAVVLVLAGFYFNRTNEPTIEKTSQPTKEEVLSQEKTGEAETIDKLEEPSPTPTSAPTSSNPFQYPGARVVSSSNNSFVLESSANSDDITNWYKDKIKESGKNVTSFVTTKTNDNVKNVLVGADSEGEVRVEITKEATTSIVEIKVEIE